LNEFEPFDKHTLFIGGTTSTRLTKEKYLSDLNVLFPKNKIVYFDGGHFIHRTHTNEVIQEIIKYCQELGL